MNKLKILIALSVISIAFAGCNSCNQQKQKGEIKIGAILPLTGKSAQYGQYIKNGLEMALTEINSSGGVNGDSLVIIYEDDQADPKVVASAIQKFVDVNKVPLVFGSWASSCVLAEAPIAEKNHLPILAEAQSPQIRDAGDYIFRIQPDSRYYLKYLAPYVYNNVKAKKLSILYVNNDYGKDQAKVFEDLFKSLGGEIVSSEGFEQGATDFKTQLTKIKSYTPDAIFIPAYVEAGYILKQAKELGITSQFIGSAPIENPEILQIAGDAANGVIYVHHFNPESQDSITANYVKKYEQIYGTQVEGYSALAYDGLFIIRDILKKCGSDKECIKNEFYKVQNYIGVTGTTSFDDHGDVIKPIFIRTIKEGKFSTIDN